jgi:uncharacterized membrane protein
MRKRIVRPENLSFHFRVFGLKMARLPMAEKRSAKHEIDLFAQTWRLPLARWLMLLAIGLSSYLLYVSLSQGAAAGCGPDSGCDRVLKSRWAYWFGLPVSAPALLVYLALFGATIGLKRTGDPALKRRIWQGMFALAAAILASAAWFIFLMVFVIQGLCPFCLAAHSSGIVIALLILLNAPVRPEPELPWQKEKHLYLPPAAAKKMALAGALAFAALAGGQALHKKQMNLVKAIPGLPNTAAKTNLLITQLATNPSLTLGDTNRLASASLVPPPPITNPAPPPVLPRTNPVVAVSNRSPVIPPVNPVFAASNLPGRVIATHNGLFQYNLNELPLLGSPDAPEVIISLFDYTCHHCHIMHGHLKEAMNYFSNRLAIVSLPMPLDAECNALIQRTHRTASNACNYARLGLAVWRADRGRFREFDDYMFAKLTPPPLIEASNYAANLVGPDKLGRALADPWINAVVQRNISLYHTNAVIMGNNGTMPQLVVGSRVSIGALNNAAEVIKLIQENLGK